jgi:hypothetical protein
MQSFKDYENFQNESRKRLGQRWIEYYKVDGITKQKSYNMRFTPNTPVEGAIYSLGQMMEKLDATLSQTADDGTKKLKIQKGYDDLEKFYLTAQKTGLVGKDISLSDLLLKFPNLFSFIRKNIRSNLVSGIIDNPAIDADVKALIIKNFPSADQKAFMEAYDKSTKSDKSEKALSVVPSSISAIQRSPRFIQLVGEVRNFLDHTGYSKLPPSLEQVYNNIVGDLSNMIETGIFSSDDVRELDKEIIDFEDVMRKTADEINDIRSRQSSNNNSLTQRTQNADEDDDDFNDNNNNNNSNKQILVERDEDYFSQAPLTYNQTNNDGDDDDANERKPKKSDDYGETQVLLQELNSKLRQIPTDYKSKKYSHQQLSDAVSKISNELLKTDRLSNLGKPSKERKKALSKAKDIQKTLNYLAPSIAPVGKTKSSPALTGKGKRATSKPKPKKRASSKPKPKPKPKRKASSSNKKKKAGCEPCKKKVSFIPEGISNY